MGIESYISNHRYIAVYPVYLSRERSKEQVDGRIINSKEVMANSQEGMMTTSKKKMIRIFRVLLARDSLYLVIATFWICVTERNSIRDDPLNFSIFNILFEIIRYVNCQVNHMLLFLNIHSFLCHVFLILSHHG